MRYFFKPFVILYIRWIQYRYKRITTQNYYKRSSQNFAELLLLQAKEYYYQRQFDAWGYYHPSCIWSEQDRKFHNWLFPEKDFKQWDEALWYHPEAVIYYHNKIFNLTKGKHTLYGKEIAEQLTKWRKENEESCDF